MTRTNLNQFGPETQTNTTIQTQTPLPGDSGDGYLRRERGRTLLGIGATVTAGILFGLQGILGKYAFDEGANVPTLLMFRFIMASLVIWTLLGILVSRKKVTGLHQPLSRTAGFGLLGLLWISNSLFYFLALELLPASTNSLLVFVYPALVVLWSVLFFKEKLTALKVIALALALGGCFLTVDPVAALAVTSTFSLVGALLSLASALSNSWYAILAGRIGPQVPGIIKAAYSLPVTAICFSVYLLVTASFSESMTVWGWVLCLVIGGLTGISIYLFLIGVSFIGPSRTAIISTSEPATTVILGTLILAEPLSIVKLVGSLCIFCAIIILSRSGKN